MASFTSMVVGSHCGVEVGVMETVGEGDGEMQLFESIVNSLSSLNTVPSSFVCVILMVKESLPTKVNKST